MIFEDNCKAGDAGCFAQKAQGVGRMVQDIDEKDAIDTPVGLGEGVAVEMIDRNVRVGTDEHIETAPLQIRTELKNAVGDAAVTTADIKDARVERKDLGEVIAEHADAAWKDMATVEGI